MGSNAARRARKRVNQGKREPRETKAPAYVPLPSGEVAFSQGAVSQRDLDFAQARALQQGEAKVQVAVPEESTFRKIFARKAKRGRTEM